MSEKYDLAEAIRSYGDVRRAALGKCLTASEQTFMAFAQTEFLGKVQLAIALERWLNAPSNERTVPILPDTGFRRVQPGTLYKNGKVHSDCLGPGNFAERMAVLFEDVDLTLTA